MPPTQRLLLAGTTLTVLLVTLLLVTYSGFWSQSSLEFMPSLNGKDRHFHLVLPATAATTDLCKLIFSGFVTGYPEPVLLGWEGHGLYNGSESHLFKISETLAYLKTLPNSADDDLVLLLDAYDVWFQLRPDVLITRYFEVMRKANQRLKDEGIHGKGYYGAKIKQSILFGADKACWPDDPRRAACWAVPESPLNDAAFGPATDADMILARPRWLNSGTILGPARDMRDMLNATMYQIQKKFDDGYRFRTSDQFYFQEMWAEQEVRRTILREGNVKAPVMGQDEVTGEDIRGHVPNIAHRRRTEFHVTIDYETKVFQTSAAYTEFITWMSFNHTTPPDSRYRLGTRLDQTHLPEDIFKSPSPSAETTDGEDDSSNDRSWSDVMLGTNGITKTIFPLFHMTGDKSYRDRWWPRMWFLPGGQSLLSQAKEGKPSTGTSDVVATVNGVKWRAYQHADLFAPNSKVTADGGHGASRGGAWSDQGAHLSWNDLCAVHEESLFA
ncbi:hypothetical protein Tdes44962_MAKER05393 [Teratosphaeria destructans]|uniref:Uncharacterized protein n=1 Tax=Teratosphaeria destructans TaxID=418781 RepID=A0A9W7SJY3_9PEZI|nr:hypothetical protein Tdes44962_MAKER05393 [Teratosphaeria destructans]